MDNKFHMGYRQTGAVYTRRSGLLDVYPDWTPIRSSIWFGFNSNLVSSVPSQEIGREELNSIQ